MDNDTATAATMESLRDALDASKAREEAYRADVVRLTATVEALRANANDADRELAKAMSRAEVLAAECNLYRKYQASMDTCDCQGDGCEVCDDAYADWQQARKHTDATNALDPAKFEEQP